MNYYEELVKRVGKAMRKHPQSTVVMDAGSFRVVAMGRNSRQLSRKLRARKRGGVAVVFEQPREDAVWILPVRLTA